MKNRRSSLALTAAPLVLAALAALVCPAAALAQDKDAKDPRPSSPTGAVPSGSGGAVVVPANPPQGGPATGKATLPRPVNYAPPEYPPEAEKQGIEGSVTLELDIDRTGKVTRAAVVEPAGHGFDEAAVNAAKKL